MLVHDNHSAVAQLPPRDRHDGLVAAAWQIAEVACLAPSVHNSQPWAWRVTERGLELLAETERRLPHVDATGRNLTISCGAALHHAMVAARALGWRWDVDLLPEEGDPTLLARLDLVAGLPSTADDVAMLYALRRRRTDRRRFTSWPVEEDRLTGLAEIAGAWGADATPVTDVLTRYRVENLVSRAHTVQARNTASRAEHRAWVDRSDVDGVPHVLVPADTGLPRHRKPRFPYGSLLDEARDLVSTDGVLVLGGPYDTPACWLRTGIALSSLWLRAELAGLSVVPLSQVVEVEETRTELHLHVLRAATMPHMLLRIGWQPLSRSALPAVPRRSLVDVVRTAY